MTLLYPVLEKESVRVCYCQVSMDTGLLICLFSVDFPLQPGYPWRYINKGDTSRNKLEFRFHGLPKARQLLNEKRRRKMTTRDSQMSHVSKAWLTTWPEGARLSFELIDSFPCPLLLRQSTAWGEMEESFRVLIPCPRNVKDLICVSARGCF